MVGVKRFQCYFFLFPTDFSPSNKRIIQSFLFLHAPSFSATFTTLPSHLCTAEGWLFGPLIGREVKKAQRVEQGGRRNKAGRQGACRLRKKSAKERRWETLLPLEGSRHWENIIQGICTNKKKQKNNANVSFPFTVTKATWKTTV